MTASVNVYLLILILQRTKQRNGEQQTQKFKWTLTKRKKKQPRKSNNMPFLCPMLLSTNKRNQQINQFVSMVTGDWTSKHLYVQITSALWVVYQAIVFLHQSGEKTAIFDLFWSPYCVGFSPGTMPSSSVSCSSLDSPVD